MTWITRELPGNAAAVFTDRHGGVSRPPFDSLNLSEHVGDDPDAVSENERRVTAGSGFPGPDRWVRLSQVHGGTAIVVDEPSGSPTEADAAVSSARDLTLLVLTADCAAVALATEFGIGVVHAGWRGLEAGVVGAAVAALRSGRPVPVRAVVGPCIHPARYEFGSYDLTRLALRFGPDVVAATAGGRPALDIPATVRAALSEAGVDDVDDVGICTASSPDHFSHRRDGTTGRQALLVVRR